MASIELVNIGKTYDAGAPPAINDLSLSIPTGQFVVMVGPSGCGKSTALRLVAGLDDPTAGTIRIAGRDMRGVPPQERDVAMVFQGYALYPHMRVRDIMAFPLKMRGMAKAERMQAVGTAAQLLNIHPLLDRVPSQLSGGERQRVAMGRAIVRKPKVFLFDEPLSNLDAALRTELRVEIRTLVRNLQATTLYVTHDHVEAMTLGDVIAVMRKGHLEQLGTPKEVYEKPNSAFVASFLGSPAMLLNDASIVDGEMRALGFKARVQPPSPLDAPVRIGIRPEHVALHPSGPGDLRVQAQVAAVEPLGAETHVHLTVDAARLRTRVPGFDAPLPGERVDAFLPPEHIHVFAATPEGKRLNVKVLGP